jgi:predicted O-methyltransferase YrrM
MGAAVTTLVAHRTREAYDAIFEAARQIEYTEVDAFERRMGYAIERERLEAAARVLACPLKANPPHWQHGRVIYAAACAYLAAVPSEARLTLLDVGTAKGFSALCLTWALADSVAYGAVVSVDVIDPEARVSRNTVAELGSELTLRETLAPWPETESMFFYQSTGIDWLNAHPDRIEVAFIDGKHDAHVVRQEGKLLSKRQEPGDLAMFDDCQIPGVSQAVASLGEFYKLEYITAGPRQYAVGVRR